MKKTYEAPKAETFGLQPESLIAASMQINNGSAGLTDSNWLSNKKSGWSSDNWTQAGD